MKFIVDHLVITGVTFIRIIIDSDICHCAVLCHGTQTLEFVSWPGIIGEPPQVD